MLIDNKTRQVVEMYSQYPFPFNCNHNDLFKNFVLPSIQALKKTKRILDAGCGTGDVSIDIARSFPGSEIVAMDITAKSLEIARAKAAEQGIRNISFCLGNLLERDSSLGTFDFIHCQGVLHHLTEPEIGLRNLAAYLNDEGVLYLWVYMLLGKQRILEIREALSTLFEDVEDDNPENRIRLAELVTATFREGRQQGNYFAVGKDANRQPLDSPVLKRFENATRLLNDCGYLYFFRRLLAYLVRTVSMKRGNAPDDAHRVRIGFVDEILHPQDRFYRYVEIRDLFEKCGFTQIEIVEGMSRSLEESFGEDHVVTKLAQTLSERMQFVMIELFERPSGIGLLLKKNP